MFLGVILVCGLNLPNAVASCVPLPSQRVFTTKEECTLSLTLGIPQVMSGAPPEAFVSSAECILLGQST